jgi:hypothetical protein
MAVGSALMLVALGEPAYGELLGHHLREGFGTTTRPDLASGWYNASITRAGTGRDARLHARPAGAHRASAGGDAAGGRRAGGVRRSRWRRCRPSPSSNRRRPTVAGRAGNGPPRRVFGALRASPIFARPLFTRFVASAKDRATT